MRARVGLVNLKRPMMWLLKNRGLMGECVDVSGRVIVRALSTTVNHPPPPSPHIAWHALHGFSISRGDRNAELQVYRKLSKANSYASISLSHWPVKAGLGAEIHTGAIPISIQYSRKWYSSVTMISFFFNIISPCRSPPLPPLSTINHISMETIKRANTTSTRDWYANILGDACCHLATPPHGLQYMHKQDSRRNYEGCLRFFTSQESKSRNHPHAQYRREIRRDKT